MPEAHFALVAAVVNGDCGSFQVALWTHASKGNYVVINICIGDLCCMYVSIYVKHLLAIEGEVEGGAALVIFPVRIRT